MRILVVDDTKDTRELLRIVLELEAHTVIEAANGLEGVETAEQWNPDLILMDLRMPVMDGYEATERIRSSPTGRNVPIVAISADYCQSSVARALEAGCNLFTTKPYSIAQLRTLLRRFDRTAAAIAS